MPKKFPFVILEILYIVHILHIFLINWCISYKKYCHKSRLLGRSHAFTGSDLIELKTHISITKCRGESQKIERRFNERSFNQKQRHLLGNRRNMVQDGYQPCSTSETIKSITNQTIMLSTLWSVTSSVESRRFYFNS